VDTLVCEDISLWRSSGSGEGDWGEGASGGDRAGVGVREEGFLRPRIRDHNRNNNVSIINGGSSVSHPSQEEKYSGATVFLSIAWPGSRRPRRSVAPALYMSFTTAHHSLGPGASHQRHFGGCVRHSLHHTRNTTTDQHRWPQLDDVRSHRFDLATERTPPPTGPHLLFTPDECRTPPA
jgi:hypothetical protein